MCDLYWAVKRLATLSAHNSGCNQPKNKQPGPHIQRQQLNARRTCIQGGFEGKSFLIQTSSFHSKAQTQAFGWENVSIDGLLLTCPALSLFT